MNGYSKSLFLAASIALGANAGHAQQASSRCVLNLNPPGAARDCPIDENAHRPAASDDKSGPIGRPTYTIGGPRPFRVEY